MRHLILATLILACCNLAIGQHAASKTDTTNYCESDWCALSKDNPTHFDPYYNGHLCENFNPKQTDFSKEYLNLQRPVTGQNIIATLSSFDLSPIWTTPDGEQNGIIGLDYTRIRVHISETKKDKHDNLLYHVKGKSNVRGNICDFSGDIRLIEAYTFQGEHENAGNLFATYTFHEDPTQKHVGTFHGILECAYFLDNKTKKGFVDESSHVADGYFNRTYVGTWKAYHAKSAKKCIWGDYRLPFTFDFDCGDGAMIVCDKYAKNGWASFNDGSDFVVVGDEVVLKDKWWGGR